LLCLAAAAGTAGLDAADLYWNGGDPVVNPANGGAGSWNAVQAWRSGSATGDPVTWSAGTGGTDAAFLGGVAGTITLGTSGSVNFTGSDLNVSASGYIIRSTASARNLVFTGNLTFSENVALTLDLANAGGVWGFGSIGFASGSSLIVKGAATANNANRLNLSAAGTIAGGAISLEGSGAGPTGFVSTVPFGSGGVILNTDIVNQSVSSATMLGATDNHLLTYGGQVSGEAGLQISAGQSGGGGTVILTAVNTYTGGTYLNTAATGVLRLGIDNALPAGTTVYFAQSAGGGTASTGGGTLDLNGRHLTVAALDGGGRGVVNTGAAPAILTLGKASGSHEFSGVIGVPAVITNIAGAGNGISLIKTGEGTQILSGANTYSGTTLVSAGTLLVNGIHSGTGTVTVADGATLGGSGSIAGGTTIETGGRITAGTAGTVGALTFSGDLTLDSGSTWLVDLVAGADGSADLLDVSGRHLSFSGSFLQVQFGGVFEPGKVYPIARFGSRSGEFSGLGEGAFVDGGNLYRISYGVITPGAITLTAVPEPGTLFLLGAGACGYALGRLRRKCRFPIPKKLES